MQLPDIRSSEGHQLVNDFRDLLNERFEDLSTVWGNKDGGALLGQLRKADGTLCYPILSRYFGAILFHHMREQEIVPGGSRADDPVIANPVVWYSHGEIPAAVWRALGTKTAKGPAYSADVLVLHTLPKSGVVDASGIGMNANELTELARALLNAAPELKTRFQEIWFLNRYITDSRRLYRLN